MLSWRINVLSSVLIMVLVAVGVNVFFIYRMSRVFHRIEILEKELEASIERENLLHKLP